MLFAVCCLLSGVGGGVCCVLFVLCYSLVVGWRLLFVVAGWCLVFVFCCVMFVVFVYCTLWCLLCIASSVVCCALCVGCWRLVIE